MIEESSMEEQGIYYVLSPTAREPSVTKGDRSGLIETESPHSVHEHLKVSNLFHLLEN